MTVFIERKNANVVFSQGDNVLEARRQAGLATVQARQAQDWAEADISPGVEGTRSAKSWASAAQSAADAAEALTGPTYSSTMEGLAATQEGQAFAVQNPDSTVTIWRHASGRVAQEQRTVATTAYLASGQGSSSIGIQRSALAAIPQNLATMIERSLSLSPEDFGAAADGITDDSVAIQAAIDAASTAGRRVHLTPGKIYRCRDLRARDNLTIWSVCGMGSGDGSQDLANRATLKLVQGKPAQWVLDVGGTHAVQLMGIQIDALTSAVPCITAGSYRLTVDGCRFIRGSFGIGGRGSQGDIYSHGLTVARSMIASNTIGLSNPIDSFFSDVHLASNGTNISAAAGANSNGFSNCRIEWSKTGRNLNIAGTAGQECVRWTFVGCQFDRGATGIRIQNAMRITFSSCWFERSNRSGSTVAEDNCLIGFQSSAYIALNGCGFSNGRDDDGGSVLVDAPDYAIYFSSNCRNISIRGGYYDPANFVAFLRSPSSCENLRVSGLPGVADLSTDAKNIQVDGAAMHLASMGTNNIAAGGGSATVRLDTRYSMSAQTYVNRAYTLRCAVRNTVTGASMSGLFLLEIRKDSASVSATLRRLSIANAALPDAYIAPTISPVPTQQEIQNLANAMAAHSAHLRAVPDVGLTGHGVLQVSINSVAPDGSYVLFDFTNTHGSHSLNVQKATLLH